ncbi:e50133c3-986b-4e7e-a85f-f0d8ec2ac5cf [Sclerotinia trifoliorum]|uniref:E50133c3-986b-4e7e-a85f-f0d8ec2ac5cf n=1 Tax=Sclerotinia trifoliorum TaxID=28548 RepID=A0A8H2W2D3_9HELO|nr:e50133c3-986b-4e7e-a85f-f0d8ec2ac5cf [Sclerotinia trifoliorum]
MFCSSLRKRQEWATLPSTLLMERMPKWKETTLNTHDLSLPIWPSKEDEREFFRVLLLSSSDMQPSTNISARIERLYHQTGGRDVGIIFLLHEKQSSDNGMKQYINLQISLMSTFKIPILPLTSISQFLEVVQTFQRQLCIVPPFKRVDAQYALLPFSNVGNAMTEHTRNILSDICRSIPELACTAATAAGQEQLREWLSEPGAESAEDVIDFWKREYLRD